MKNILVASILVVTSLVMSNQSATAQLSEEVVRKTPEIPGIIAIDFGFNLLTGKPDDWSDVNWARSRSVGFYFIKPFDINEKFEFRPGVGLTYDKIGSKNADFLDDNDAEVSFLEDIESSSTNDVIKAQIGYGAIEVPLELRYNIKGNKSKASPFVALGVSPAFVFDNKIKIRAQNLNSGEKFITKFTGDADLLETSKLRLLATGRIGIGPVSFFYKHYLTSVFNGSSVYSGDINMSTIGITVTGF